jgi:hypothetical protein
MSSRRSPPRDDDLWLAPRRASLLHASTLTLLSVAALHLYQGAMSLAFESAMGATQLLAVRDVLQAYGLSAGHIAVGMILVISALMSAVGAAYRIGRARMLLFVPQHFLLGVMTGGGVWATVAGHYLDRTVIPWQHISVGEAPTAALLLAHTAAVLYRCWSPE